MGALLTKAVADQLRQVPGFQAQPSPPVLLQQILNQPGPSRPMWQAPVMENRQLLATSMDPMISQAQQDALNQALAQNARSAAIAFGGADITKEDRLKWEKENAEYKQKNRIPTGTRVKIADDILDRAKWLNKKTNRARFFLNNGQWPKIPLGGMEGEVLAGDANESQIDAMRQGWHPVKVVPWGDIDPSSAETWWIHRDNLETIEPDFLYRSTHRSILMDQIRHHTHIFYETPELAEKHRITIGNFSVDEPPIMTRIPRSAQKWAYAQGSRREEFGTGEKEHFNPWRATDQVLDRNKIQVETKDGRWISLLDWLKRGNAK